MSDKYAGGILAGSTSVTTDILLRKKTDNTELTGIAYNTSGNIASYRRGAVGARVAITLATQTATGAYSSGGFAEIDATNQPGLYRLDIPDAAVAAGVDYVTISIVTTNGYAYHERIPLTTNVVQGGDNFARLGAPAGASHAADVAAVKVDTAAIKVTTDKFVFTVANQVDSNVLDWKSATAPAMTGDAYARLGAPAGASHAADVAAVKVDTAAVKVQTDKMVFTVANQLDVNVLDWKSATAPAMTGDSFARLGAPAGASVSADIAAAKVDTAAIKVTTDKFVFTIANQVNSTVVTVNTGVVDANAVASDIVTEIADAARDSVFAKTFGTAYGSLTFFQIVKIKLAVLVAKCTGLAGATATFRNIDDSADVVVSGVDANGNRGVPTLTP